jgi:rhodanese-related sulfurtransferase
MNFKTLWIDIRDEHELAENQIMAPNDETLIINIPSRNIFANVQWIKSVAKDKKIILICRSGNRSLNVKRMYFANDENIESLDGGIKNAQIKLKGLGGGLGLQQILQLVFAFILVCILCASFFLQLDNLRYAIIGIIFFILYQVISKSCLIGKYVPLKVA